jgi:uncharacterized repeat protein (TIGR01451 family)
MDLEINGLDWTSASRMGSWYPFPDQPGAEATWAYTDTFGLGRGNHTFFGRAYDRAGNAEAPHELARLLWFPQSAPELAGSALVARPATLLPGDEVVFTIAVRNGGNQQAWMEIVDSLPPGMTPVDGGLAPDAVNDEASRTVTWPARLLWPGQWRRIQLPAMVDEELGSGTLENRATARAFWPNTDGLADADRQRFEELERTVDLSTTITVDPGLADGADVAAPWAHLSIRSGQAAYGQKIQLGIVAPSDAMWMYLREWALDPANGDWVVVGDSGWRAYQPEATWTLSPGAGVKHLGAWVADGAGNVSTLDEHGLAFTNLLARDQALADGLRHQYRFDLDTGNLVIYNLAALAGDPDMYVWSPRHALLPNHAAEGDGLVDVIGFWPEGQGVHLLEVVARGDSVYQLLPAPQPEADLAGPQDQTADNGGRPSRPLTVSDPLSAGAEVDAPVLALHRNYLPVVLSKGQVHEHVLIGIGGPLAGLPLPHHRAYGSRTTAVRLS